VPCAACVISIFVHSPVASSFHHWPASSGDVIARDVVPFHDVSPPDPDPAILMDGWPCRVALSVLLRRFIVRFHPCVERGVGPAVPCQRILTPTSIVGPCMRCRFTPAGRSSVSLPSLLGRRRPMGILWCELTFPNPRRAFVFRACGSNLLPLFFFIPVAELWDGRPCPEVACRRRSPFASPLAPVMVCVVTDASLPPFPMDSGFFCASLPPHGV